MASPLRIGLFGGTFDPVHNAHLDIARAARDQADLDKLLFVVAARPPHKSAGPHATPEERFAMVQLAIAGEPKFEASRVELERQGASYTADTLQTLARQYPSAEFYLILGADSAEEFPQWRNTEAIRARAKLLIVPRPGHDTVPPVIAPDAHLLTFDTTPLSSTEVRNRIDAGAPLRGLVPDAVEAYIHKRALYSALV